MMVTIVTGELENKSSAVKISESMKSRTPKKIDDSKATIEIPHYILTPGDVKAIEDSFSLVAASASLQDLGIGFFRL